MKKQTSVDWLYDKLEHTRFPTVEELNEILQTARQMHRKEIEEAYNDGFKEGENFALGDDDYFAQSAKNYYTETFQQHG